MNCQRVTRNMFIIAAVFLIQRLIHRLVNEAARKKTVVGVTSIALTTVGTCSRYNPKRLLASTYRRIRRRTYNKHALLHIYTLTYIFFRVFPEGRVSELFVSSRGGKLPSEIRN